MCNILLSNRMENHKGRNYVSLDLSRVVMLWVCIMEILDLGAAANEPGSG
jgi:hypothetical protein